uniref:HPP transmembrane region domain-containing protein n=1 Tax=Paramoeba aestuarina TaxID=180227 RepID=A0A7S4PMD6_9EUKA
MAFSVPESPLVQPRNMFFGQMIAATIGIICRLYIAEPMGTKGLALPLSVTSSLLVMMLTRSVHPPAGGTAAIAILTPAGDRLGWGFLVPVLTGTLLGMALSVLVNNLRPKTVFPTYWFFGKPEPYWFCI